MDIGKLKHRITIQEYKTLGQDPITGDMVSDWVNRYITWACITGVSGREFLQSNAEQSATTFRITMRWAKLHPAMRIGFDDEIFNIKAILPDNDRGFLTVMAEKGVNNG